MRGVIQTSVAGYAFGENPKEAMDLFNLVARDVLMSTFNCTLFYFRAATWLVTLLTLSQLCDFSIVFSSSAVTF